MSAGNGESHLSETRKQARHKSKPAEPPKVEAATPEPDESEAATAPCTEPAASAEVPAEIVAAPESPVRRTKFALRAKRFTPLAAAIALSAALGGMAGSLAATSLMRVAAPAPAVSPANDIGVKQAVARIESELAALRASTETSGQTASVQFARIADRLDRGERAQAEPVARLAKISESLERIERRAAPTPSANPNDAAGAKVAAAEPPRQGPEVLEGWNIRRARNGIALIQGRMGLVEIETGDRIPGLGRIEEIRRKDGRWVVVTSRGVIVER
jgi:hypothetical protein